MSDFKRLNSITKRYKNELNLMYQDLGNKFFDEALSLTGLDKSKNSKIAILKRVVDLKEEGIVAELKKLGKNDKEIADINAKMFDFVSKFYINRHAQMLLEVKNAQILDDFDFEILNSVHQIGIVLTSMQKQWQKLIIESTNEEFKAKFKDLNEANDFITKHELYQKNSDGSRCDRVYGAVLKTDERYQMAPYAVAFKDATKELETAFLQSIARLNELAKNKEDEAYILYFTKLKEAFLEDDNDKVVQRWQDAERAWMQTKKQIQVGHPLEYYEDAYTHAVALEWDVRLVDDLSIDETKFKSNIKDSFCQIYKNIGAKNENMSNLVHSNIDKTQLYISNPILYYGAEFNGLFSAQVVPNDEIVSNECGKKIFAFVNFVYESAKSKPFSALANEIFSKEFLDYGRNILFKEPQIWKKVYEISTIGHEFGHILFIDSDTENKMNQNGEFKFIEEYKATTGGLINFFLHEDERYKMAVFYELIKRSIGLIAWQKVVETRAYYCEGLIHLSLLFRAGVLEFDGEKLDINFSLQSYESFKTLALQNYQNLASHYANKLNASEFLAKFAKFKDDIYLPNDETTAEFVKFYYQKYEKMANDIDESGEWEKWQKFA